MTRWQTVRAVITPWVVMPAGVSLLAALLTAQVAWAQPGLTTYDALWLALRLGVLAGAAVALARAGIAMVLAAHGRSLSDLGAVWIAVATGAAVLGMALFRVPSRLVLNEAGFLCAAAPLGWAVGRRAGKAHAASGVVALALVALVSTTSDMHQPLRTFESEPDSPFRWTVGWPNEGWVLRHQLRLPESASGAYRLDVPLAGAYDGPARISVRLDGVELPDVTVHGTTLSAAIPAGMLATSQEHTFELRQSPPDPRLRLTAFRTGRGATLGMAASSYFDPQDGEWRRGTYNDALGRPQPGIIVVDLAG